MKSRPSGFRQAICTAILLGTVSAAALANQSPTLRAGPATPLCYCHCAYETGQKHYYIQNEGVLPRDQSSECERRAPKEECKSNIADRAEFGRSVSPPKEPNLRYPDTKGAVKRQYYPNIQQNDFHMLVRPRVALSTPKLIMRARIRRAEVGATYWLLLI